MTALEPGPPRCRVCGSVFFEHSCHAAPGWIALMIARGRKR